MTIRIGISGWTYAPWRGVGRVSSAKARTKVKDIFVYFDNDMKVRAPFDAMKPAKRLKVKAGPPPLEDFMQKKTRGRRKPAAGGKSA